MSEQHTDGSCFMRCQKKGFGEIKRGVREVFRFAAESVESRPGSSVSPQRGASRFDLHTSGVIQMSFFDKAHCQEQVSVVYAKSDLIS